MGTITTLDGTINRQKYVEILENNLWPVIAQHFPNKNFLFQDDNAHIHRVRDVENYILARNNVHSISWTAQSPDLNIIENVWLKLKRGLQHRVENTRPAAEHSHAITQEWQTIYRGCTDRCPGVRDK